MDDERDIGEEAEHAVGREHEGDDQHAGRERRPFSGLDGIAAEARPDDAALDDCELCRKCAGAQQDREVVGLLDREVAGDLARAAGDRRVDARRRHHLVVEDDRHALADVLRGRLTEALGALQVELEAHHRLLRLLVEGRLRVGEVAAVGHDPALDRHPRAVLVLGGQEIDIARGRVGQHAEFELGGLAELLFEELRILQAGHLHEDAVGALLLDRGLLGAAEIDAAADDLDGLGHGPAGPVGEARLCEGELDQSVLLVGDLHRLPAGLADEGVRDRLRQLAELRDDLGPVGGIGDPHLHPARDDLDAALRRHPGLAQDPADIVAQARGLGLQKIVPVDLQQDLRTALEVEPEDDRPARDDPTREPARKGGHEPAALLGREEARHGQTQPDQNDREGRDDLGSREAQHTPFSVSCSHAGICAGILRRRLRRP